ncbi:MAG: hypothetical protein ACT4O1_16785 [Gemmatimonadota bacterium]
MTCPRCGPSYGLILLADQVENRRVLEGSLGCANCRERYPVRAGFCDLRYGFRPETEAEAEPETATDVTRLAALLGLTEGPALVLIAGAGAANAAALADLIEGIEAVAAWAPLAAEQERAGVSRFATSGVLPFRSGSMRAIALTDDAAADLIEEAARVAAPRARVVVCSNAETGTTIKQRLERSGLHVLAQDERTTVAERTRF